MIYKKVVFITAIFISLWCTNKSMAQTKVSGTVTENGNLPVPGVSVIIKGTSIGVSTDFDGNYSLSEGITNKAILVFSYVGFKTQEILVNGQSVINVSMQEDASLLDEVVLVGYGSQLKKDITGSVATIDSEAFESRPNTQVGSLLQGQSAGVQVISGSGKPSGGFSVRIRGTNSINASSEPLYVVDGVPTNDTRAINPSDIDTITILKDASSAAIYGFNHN